jgi:hypothetical protein
MAAKKGFLGFIDAGREKRRAPLVGMQFLHQRAMRTPDVVGARAGMQTKDLLGLLLRHFSAARRAPPRCRVRLRVLTPAGIPAVKVSHK